MRERLVEFLLAIPESFPDPDVRLTDDGSYCVDWTIRGWHLFSVSIGEAGYSFAYTLPSDGSGHGFVRKEDVQELVEHMEMVMEKNR